MKTLKLRENFYWTGIVDANLRVFDIIMYTEFGTTYNSYVLKAGDKTILFETAKEKFFDEYLEKLREIIDVEHIDYLVVEHTEPDHAGSVELLLDINPGHEDHCDRMRSRIFKGDREPGFHRDSGEGQYGDDHRGSDTSFSVCAKSALAGYDVHLY